MHDIRLIRDDPDAFDAGLKRRGLDPLSGRLIRLDEARRAAVSALQAAQERRNALSREVGAAKKARDEARAAELMAEVARLKDGTPALETAERGADRELEEALAEIPNLPGPEVPEGADEHGNVERADRRFAGRRTHLESGRQHFELGEAWRVGNGTAMDFEAAARLSGSRFVVLRGQLARLERALGQFMLDLHTGEHGYTEVSPPLMVQDEAMFGTAQLPKFEEDQFAATRLTSPQGAWIEQAELQSGISVKVRLEPDALGRACQAICAAQQEGRFDQGVLGRILELTPEAKNVHNRGWLIPTAEVPLTNLVRESILSEEELPLRFTALTPCFRAEAGAAGRDTRGMLRQHQFSKCELVSITTPDASAQEHERMLGCAEAVLKALELPFRVMTLCTGDMGFASAKTYDIEVWMPGQGTYREISSCSVCGEFQARRMNARYRPRGEKSTRFLHTLNGSGVAVGRALIAVMENYQQADGTVAVPAVLQRYMGGLERIGDPS